MSGRAQTEAIGVVTVTAVVLLLAFTVGFAVVGSMTNGESTAPALGDYSFDADGTAVSVTHASGDAVPLSDLSLVVRGPNGSTSRPFTAGTLADGGAVFRPGSTWRYDAFPFPFDRAVELELLVLHGPSGTVVDRTTVRVGSASTPTDSPTPTATQTATPTSTPTPTATPTPVPTPPEVQSFEATNPDRRNVRVELRTDERLSDLRVVLYRGDDERAVRTLTRGQFAESGDGPYTYVATTPVARSGSYRVVLESATNDAGADAGDGRTRRVDVDADDHGRWWDRWWDWWDDWWGGDDQGDDDEGGWWDGGWNWWPW